MLARDIDTAAHDCRPEASATHGQGAPTWAQARQLAFRCAHPLPSVSVPLAEAHGRHLASDVAALQDMPHYASSAMDGWATNGSGPWFITQSGQALSPGQASVVATGGIVPVGAVAVLRKESGLVSEDASGKNRLTLNANARTGEPLPGQHIRPAGEEARSGAVLLPAGTILNPAHIALAAGAGHDELQVQARPLVAVILTGSEVVTSGIPAPGQVRDTFGPQLGTVISLLGGTPGGTQRVGDSYDEWLMALGGTLLRPGPDVTVTTGGTGQSGSDHFRSAVRALGGRLRLDGIAMRPGHPAVLAELPNSHFVIGLPGNPLAAMMALLTLGEPLLAALGNRPLKAVDQVPSGTDLDPAPGRTRLIPCRVVNGLALPEPHASPGMMRGLAWADAVMAVPPQGVEYGEPLPVVSLPWKEAMTPHPPTDFMNQQGRHKPWDA